MRQPSIYLPMMSHRSVSSVLRGAIRSTDHDFLRVFPFQYLESPEAPRASHRRGDSPAFIPKKKQLKKTTIKQVQPYSITLLGQVKIHTADI